jgi:hypothetical protein
MMKYFVLLLLCLGLCGCASVKDRITLAEDSGIERTYDYPYKKVFYACEDTIPRIYLQGRWVMLESNFDDGYIYIVERDTIFSLTLSSAAIKIKKIDDNKTLIKILQFQAPRKKVFYKDFFDNLDALLRRE